MILEQSAVKFKSAQMLLTKLILDMSLTIEKILNLLDTIITHTYNSLVYSVNTPSLFVHIWQFGNITS